LALRANTRFHSFISACEEERQAREQTPGRRRRWPKLPHKCDVPFRIRNAAFMRQKPENCSAEQ
jgi:transposase